MEADHEPGDIAAPAWRWTFQGQQPRRKLLHNNGGVTSKSQTAGKNIMFSLK